MATWPIAFGAFGYGTAALTYGLHLLTGFPKAKNEDERRKIRAALVANGWAFGGIAQFTAGLILFTLFNDIVDATTFAIFGVLWTAIWLNDYFDLDPRPLTFLDIAIAIYTVFAGSWALILGHPVVAFLLWSITALVISLCWLHAKNKGAKISGSLAFENAMVAYYVAFAFIYTQLGIQIPF